MGSFPSPELLAALRCKPRDRTAWDFAMLLLWPIVRQCARRIVHFHPHNLWNEEDLADEVAVELEVRTAWVGRIAISAPDDAEAILTTQIERVAGRVWKRMTRPDAFHGFFDEGAAAGRRHVEDPGSADAETAPRVHRAMDKMSKKDRRLLYWACVENRSQAEIARKLRLSKNAARKRLARAKKTFKKLYLQEGKFF